MGRPKIIPVYNEGPQAATNFDRAMRTILAAGRPTIVTEHTTVTDKVTIETNAPKKKKIRSRRK